MINTVWNWLKSPENICETRNCKSSIYSRYDASAHPRPIWHVARTARQVLKYPALQTEDQEISLVATEIWLVANWEFLNWMEINKNEK